MSVRAAAALLVGMMTMMLSGGASAQTKIALRIGHVTSLQAIAGQGSSKLKEVAESLSNGEIEIQIFPNSQLGGELEMVSQVRLGTLDMAMAGAGIVAAIEPTFSITELPFIWKSRDLAWKVLNGPAGDKMFALLEPKGIKALSWGVWDMRGFLTVGFDVTKPDEVAKSLTVSDHIWTATVFVINKKKFESLSPKLQEVMITAAKQAGQTMFVNAGKANADAIALMEKNGVKILRPERADFEKAVEPVHKYFSNLVGADLLEEVKAAQK